MPKKRFSAEQIVTLLRQIEVSIAQGKSAPVSCAANFSSWHFASVQTHGLNGRYRMHSGQGSEPALNGSARLTQSRHYKKRITTPAQICQTSLQAYFNCFEEN